MEASALNNAAAPAPALVGRSPLLRLQGDERLIALIRRGNHGAFETLVGRYQSRLLSFCRHMLGSTEDAEDVLQEVLAAAFNAICADERPINARPWLYRIARNRCLNHLRRPVHSGQDSMDVFERDGGQSTADTVHRREEFRQVVADVRELPETQRTALLLREMDALSYDQIAEAMDTTVPSIKSLLVRARVSLAEASEARLLSCDEVRFELGQVAEGLAKSTAPVRRHLKGCDRCRLFKRELRKSTLALAAIYPIGPLVILQKLFLGKLGLGALGGGSGAVGGSAAAGGSVGVAGGSAGVAGGTAGVATGSAGVAGIAGGSSVAGGAAAGGAGAGGILSFGGGALASKAAAGFVAAAIVTAGAVEVEHVRDSSERAKPAAEATLTPRADDRPAPLPLAGTEGPEAGAVVPGAEALPTTPDEADGTAVPEGTAEDGEDADAKDADKAVKAGEQPAPGAAVAGTPTAATPGHGAAPHAPPHPHPTVPRDEHGSATVALPAPPPEFEQAPVAPEPAAAPAEEADGGESSGGTAPDTGVDAVDDASSALP